MKTKIKRALVTGGAGFIGSHIVDRLVENGTKVVVIDNFSTGSMNNLARHSGSKVKIDNSWVNDGELVPVIRGCDTVFHFQANADVRGGERDPIRDFQWNTWNTHHLLVSAWYVGIKRFIFASSAVVYGEPDKFPTPEDYAPTQTSHYGASKLAGEAMVQAFAHYNGWDAHIFRMVSILGERYSHGCVKDFLDKLSGKPKRLKILGDGRQTKSFLDVSDAVNGIFTALEKEPEGGVFNLGHEETVTVEEVARWVAQEAGRGDIPFKLGSGQRGWKGDSPLVMLDTSKMEALGWKPKVGIEQAVRNTARYLINRR